MIEYVIMVDGRGYLLGTPPAGVLPWAFTPNANLAQRVRSRAEAERLAERVGGVVQAIFPVA